MKASVFYIAIFQFFSLCLTAQQNNSLRGKVLFLNSGKKPAIGVEINGKITGIAYANTVYTDSEGSFNLIFSKTVIGKPVALTIGDTDGDGQAIELVNEKEVADCRVPAIPTEEFKIIVCRKGERDRIAQRYYKVIKTSAERELDKLKKQMDNLLAEKEENRQIISRLSTRIAGLERQTDSITLYREAFRLASINKDNASDRIRKYLDLLDQGKSLQEALDALSKKAAAKELRQVVPKLHNAIGQLENRAEASKILSDYKDAIDCYARIINHLERMHIDRSEKAYYYARIADVHLKAGDHEMALDYQQRAVTILENISDGRDPGLAVAYGSIGTIYRISGRYRVALNYHQKALTIREAIPGPGHPDLAASYNDIALTYQQLEQYKKALVYHRKAISMLKKDVNPESQEMATAYHNTGLTYHAMKKYKKALEYVQKAIVIREAVLGPGHPDLGLSYMNVGIIYATMEDPRAAIPFLEKSRAVFKGVFLKDHPYSKKALCHIGLAYAKNRQFKKACTVFTEYEELFPGEGKTYFNWTVYYALQNDKQEALANLQKAVALGYHDLKWLKKDRSLKSLRNEKVFKETLKRTKRSGKK